MPALWRPAGRAWVLLAVFASHAGAQAPGAPPALRIVTGVTPGGDATGQWLAMIRKRLPDRAYQAVAGLRKPLTATERGWADLIRSRAAAWEGAMPGLAELIRPIDPPALVSIVTGNRGGEDAFTHDSTTIGFDLAALHVNYGDATLPENADRVDRFFRHEYAHLLQKAWLREHPYTTDTPLRAALWDIWAEGIGNYFSLSPRWHSEAGRPSEAAVAALAELEPRFVARLAALACASLENGPALAADLSWGRFDRKWGALPAALWLGMEVSRSSGALREFLVAGPDSVWALAERHLAEPLRATLREARVAGMLCGEDSAGEAAPGGAPGRRGGP